jgi:hypothetical protein
MVHRLTRLLLDDAIVVSITPPPPGSIIAWPDELVAFSHDNPGAVIIKTKVLFDGPRNFDRLRRAVGRAVSHWQNRHQRFTAMLALHGHGNDARTVFAPFLLAALRFVVPNIRIRDDETRLRQFECRLPTSSVP